MKLIAAEATPNALAFQHNQIIRAPLRMGLMEARVFIHALGQIRQTDKVFKPIKIPLEAIVGKEPGGEAYEAAKAACNALVHQILNVLPPNARRGNLRKVPLMASIDLDLGTGLISGQFNELAKPYLLQLKEGGNFTSAAIQKLLTFNNANSARLYWILLSFRNLEGKAGVVKKQLELEELKRWMLATDGLYPVFADFKKRVLDPIAEDFKLIGFKATWVPVKTGKRITALLFTIPKDKPEPKALAAAPGTAATKEAASEWDAWLAAADPKLRTAYAGLLDVNKLTATTAKRIVRWVAQHPDQAPAFFKARHSTLTPKEPVKDMRAYTLARLNEALGTAFK